MIPPAEHNQASPFDIAKHAFGSAATAQKFALGGFNISLSEPGKLAKAHLEKIQDEPYKSEKVDGFRMDALVKYYEEDSKAQNKYFQTSGAGRLNIANARRPELVGLGASVECE